MSWESYVEDNLMEELKPNSGRTLAFAAIVGLDGGVWAQSSEFPDVSPEQLEALAKGFEDESALQEKGVELGDTRYVLIQGEAGSVIRGKKGASGFTSKKTNTAVVIGGYGEGTQPGECSFRVEQVADELMKESY